MWHTSAHSIIPRPFQVNPPPQFLNLPGGVATLRSLELQGRTVRLVRFGRRCDTGVMAGHHDKVVHTHEAQGQEGDHDKAWKHVSHRPHLTIVTRAECARAPKPLSRL